MNHHRSSNGEARPESLTKLRAQFTSIVESQTNLRCSEMFDRADRVAKARHTEIEGRRTSLYETFDEAHNMGSKRDPWRKRGGTDLQLLVHFDHMELKHNQDLLRTNLLEHFSQYLSILFDGSFQELMKYVDEIINDIHRQMRLIQRTSKTKVKVIELLAQWLLPDDKQICDGYLSEEGVGFMDRDSVGNMLLTGQKGIHPHDQTVIHGCYHMRCTSHARVQQLMFRLGIPYEKCETEQINRWMIELGRAIDIRSLPTGCTMGTVIDPDLTTFDFSKTDILLNEKGRVPDRPGLREEVLEGGNILPSNLLIALDEITTLMKQYSSSKTPTENHSRSFSLS